MVEVIRLLQILAIVWVVRFLWRMLVGTGSRSRSIRQSERGGPFQSRSQARSSGEATIRGGEMKKDPQCGTYVSTELSVKSNLGNEVLHFCSPECQHEFLQARARKTG